MAINLKIMKPNTLDRFEYLIEKTMTYLQFHHDDLAKELVKEWYPVLRQVQELKQASSSGKNSAIEPKKET